MFTINSVSTIGKGVAVQMYFYFIAYHRNSFCNEQTETVKTKY